MWRFALILSILVGPLVAASECDVELTIEWATQELEVSRHDLVDLKKVRAVLTNNGPDSVVLVHPGNGSWEGRRTPSVSWWVNGTKHQNDVTGTCGSIHRLRPQDIIDLGPGQRVELAGCLPPLQLPEPGSYELALVYRNDPTIPISWLGVSFPHDPEALQRMERSTPCAVTSNRVELRIRGSR